MAVQEVIATLEDETTVLQNEYKNTYSGELAAPISSGDYAVNVSAYDDAGNISIAKSTINVTLWHAPRTDWKPTDRFNISDYNRIKNNLMYLHELAVSLWKEFPISEMGEDMMEYTGYWNVDIFNLFESNLEAINQNIFTQNFGVSQRFFENGPFIRWEELNRIEGAILSMNELLERQKAGLHRLSFRLGVFKEVMI